MTMIIAVANDEHIIQLSDRRLSSQLSVVDESNKAGSFVSDDGRFVYGYAGLAKVGVFNTNKWILDTLLESAPPDYLSIPMLHRFRKKATDFFRADPSITQLSLRNRRISIMFTGYLYENDPPIPVFLLVSNFEDYQAISPVAWQDFKITGNKLIPNKKKMTLIQVIGSGSELLSVEHMKRLENLLLENKPMEAVVGSGVKIIREVSDQSKGTVGKQISSIYLPRDSTKSISGQYHTSVLSHYSFLPNHSIFTSERGVMVMMDFEIRPQVPTSKNYISIPKVGRNAPCPCSSGKKYKRCHGASSNY